MEKRSLTQQKHAFTNQRKCTTTHLVRSELVRGPSGMAWGERRGGAAAGVPVRPRRRPEVSPLLPMVRRRPIWSLDDVVATKHSTTSCLTLCGAQLDTSGRFPHPSNYSWLINSTSGLGTAPETWTLSMPTHEVQRFRHFAIVFAHFPGISDFPSPKWRQ